MNLHLLSSCCRASGVIVVRQRHYNNVVRWKNNIGTTIRISLFRTLSTDPLRLPEKNWSRTTAATAASASERYVSLPRNPRFPQNQSSTAAAAATTTTTEQYAPIIQKNPSTVSVSHFNETTEQQEQPVIETTDTTPATTPDTLTTSTVEQDSNSSNIATMTMTTMVSPSELTYTGGITIPITSFLHIVTPQEDAPSGIWPIFRLMDENGSIRNAENDGYHGGGSRSSDDGRIGEMTTGTSEKLHVLDNAKNNNSNSNNNNNNNCEYSLGDDLHKLQTLLHNKYPLFHFDQNPLLQSAKYEYPDTASTNTLLRAHTQMIRLRQMDTILQNAQRQGRISFYMTCRGEEAIHFGAASALSVQDTVLAQYREAGVLMWRGFTLQQFADQCFSNKSDLGKARQMPVHYGSRALNYQTISSPLGTQLPQAVGAAYRSKIEKKKQSNVVTIAFFGDGCASTTDFHSACNFAATLKVPVIFFCRNNGYAISTPVSEQFAGDGIISRCKGYGMAGIRVDGNDLFAVSAAVHAAKVYALENSAPVMIEAMTYRQGHHSTSDDSTRYRGENVETLAAHDVGDPFSRMSLFLQNYGILNPHESLVMEDAEKFNVLQAMEAAEKKGPPPLTELFEDVYKVMPHHLKLQKQQLDEHLSKHGIRRG